MEPFVEHLVVDSAGFIRLAKLQEIGRRIYTIREVVDEIKDKQTRERLQILPYDLCYLDPEPNNTKFLSEFAKKTGDYPSLSATDLKVLAAAYELEKIHVGIDHLKAEPQKSHDNAAKSTSSGGEMGNSPENEEENQGVEKPETPIDIPATANTKNIPPGFYVPKSIRQLTDDIDKLALAPKSEEDHVTQDSDEDKVQQKISDEEEEDNEEGWITPSNLCKLTDDVIKRGRRPIEVGCITGDFAMQNVLMHLGMNVLGVDGLLIKRLNTYILRCFLCFKTTSVMTRKFCSECGNQTLKRVAITVQEDGSQQIHISRRRTINTKGTNKSIPAPRGGKHADNPILCADQPVPENRLSRKALQRLNVMDDDYTSRDSPFLQKDVYSRSALLGVRKLAPNRNKRRK